MNIIALITMETKDAAVKNDGTIAERFLAAKKVAKNHWLVTNDSDCFRGALAGLLLSYKEDDPEYERIKTEIKAIHQLNVMMQASAAGLTVSLPETKNDFEPIGLLKLWKES